MELSRKQNDEWPKCSPFSDIFLLIIEKHLQSVYLLSKLLCKNQELSLNGVATILASFLSWFESDDFIAYSNEWDWREKNDVYSH